MEETLTQDEVLWQNFSSKKQVIDKALYDLKKQKEEDDAKRMFN